MTKRWRRGFDAAKAASAHSNAPTSGWKLGAALYAGNKLLSFGYNDWYKTTPHAHNKNTHAEVMCLVRRRHYDHNDNLTLYIHRQVSNSSRSKHWLGCSRPCEDCMNVIRISGVKTIRYYNEAGVPEEIKL